MIRLRAKTPDSISSSNAPILTSETLETETTNTSQALAADSAATLAIANIVIEGATVITTLEDLVRSKFLSLRSIDRRVDGPGDVTQQPMTQRNLPILRPKNR